MSACGLGAGVGISAIYTIPWGVIPACLVIAGMIAVFFYPITKKRHEQIHAALAAHTGRKT